MIHINGKYTDANIYTDNIESEALSQVYEIISHPTFKDESVKIMPDVHAGKGCVIGFTATNKSCTIIPNLIGVDIGCGMKTVNLGNIDLDLVELDRFIRHKIPHGCSVNSKISKLVDNEMTSDIKKVCDMIGDDWEKFDYHLRSIGSLGGGNHFIEISVDKDNNKYLIIHSGSRNFGHRIATYFQKLAIQSCKSKSAVYSDLINKLRGGLRVDDNDPRIKEIKDANIYQVDKQLTFLEGADYANYMFCMRVAQRMAVQNRDIIAKRILEELNITPVSEFETIHNYIDDNDIIRKGAVSAKKDEILLIPMNMRDGSILAKGKGNADWNNSAPHGAGRLMSRSKAKAELNLDNFHKQMQDIYTTSVGQNTLDEAPDAYKPMQEILDNIGDTVEIIDILKPIHNFKAH